MMTGITDRVLQAAVLSDFNKRGNGLKKDEKHIYILKGSNNTEEDVGVRKG